MSTLSCPTVLLVQALPALEGLRVVFAGAGRTLVTLLIVLGAPAALGALRAVLSGEAVEAFTAPPLWIVPASWWHVDC